MLLSEKVCIITGAASARGIGRATARLFAEHGGRAIILDLDEKHAKAAAREIGEGHRGLACDVTDKSACLASVDQVIREFGRVDVLINNAGITQPLKIMDIEPKHYDAVLDVNLRGTLYMSQAVIPHMRRQGSGSIVCLSSVSAQRGGGIFGGPHYSAAKAGILGLTKATAREFASHGIRANAICPGFIGTDITGSHLTEEQRALILAGIPMGRIGAVEDVAGCALFLASDLSAY